MKRAIFAFLISLAAVSAATAAPQDSPDRVSPSTPEEWSAIRSMLLPGFLKDVDQFKQASRNVVTLRNRRLSDPAMQTTLNKETKRLEERIDRMLDYILDGEAPSSGPRIDAADRFTEHLSQLDAAASSVVRSVPQYVSDQQHGSVDARREDDIVQNLLAVRLLARDLRRDVDAANRNVDGSGVALPLPPRNGLTGMQFVRIPAGEFTMGCTDSEQQCDKDEFPAHRVQISKAFEMGMYEVTQAEWEAVMGSNPSHFNGEDLPVEQVSWTDVQEFLAKLNQQQDGYLYRLPTEAEWEYAARAGASEERVGSLDAIAWYSGNAGSHTHPVGLKEPNAWGLYDMIGNVWEWVEDWYDSEFYKAGREVDPSGPANGQNRSIRGGSWYYVVAGGRASYRDDIDPKGGYDAMGFRCVRETVHQPRR